MSDPYRILITGSRSWTDEKVIAEAIFKAIDDQGVTPGRDYVIVHGACGQGADALAAKVCEDEAWWLDRLGAALVAEPHPADWDSCADHCSPAHRKRRWDGTTYCPAAGLRRDAEMVAAGADVCLAFVAPCVKPACRKRKPHGSHGASHTARIAEKAGIEVRRFTP